MSMREAENKVYIEGILSETDLKHYHYEKDGKQTDAVGGIIKVRVEQEICGENKVLEIPVHLFSNKITLKGKPNPSYESIEAVMTHMVSIAASENGIEGATRIRIGGGKLVQNEFYTEDGRFVSYTRINGSFVNTVKKEDFNPRAIFSNEFVVGNMVNEADKDGVDTGRLIVEGIIPGYNGKIQVTKFIAASPSAVEGISQLWQKGDTVKCAGKLNFSSTTEVIKEQIGFGDPVEKRKTNSVSELIITGGANPLEGEFAFDIEDINAAIADRKAYLEELKGKKSVSKAAPVKGSGMADLGF